MQMICLPLSPGTEDSHSRSFTSISSTYYFSCSRYSRAFLMFLVSERSPPQRQLLWMFWLQQQQLQTHHHHSSEVVRFLFDFFCIVISFINYLLILIRIFVLAIVGSDTFVCLASYACISHLGYIKSYSVYIYIHLFVYHVLCPYHVQCFSFQLNN